jgi:hypothetical protein
VPRRDTELIPIVQRSYDLCVGLHEHVSRVPRAQRGLLGRTILDEGLRMLTLLAATNRAADRLPGLTEASGRLDALRITPRLSNRLGFLSHGAYERLCEVADEVGRMLGGWIKHGMAQRRTAAATEASVATARSETAAGAQGAGGEPSRRPGGVRYTITSPTIERYLRVKLAHPESVVFLVVGAFC